jgi:hypothetical protein
MVMIEAKIRCPINRCRKPAIDASWIGFGLAMVQTTERDFSQAIIFLEAPGNNQCPVALMGNRSIVHGIASTSSNECVAALVESIIGDAERNR